MNKYIKYLAFIAPAILAITGLLSYFRDRKMLSLAQEKSALEKELLSLQISSLKKQA